MPLSPFVPFPGWAPDRINSFQGGGVTARNVVPTVDGFRPLRSFTRFSTNALDAKARGFITAQGTDGNKYLYAGDKTKLYRLIGTSFSDASSSVSGTYDLGATGVWEFTQFGNRIIAACPDFDHQPQQTTIGSLTFSTTLITSTDQPKMKHITSLRDFVVGGNISSTAGGLTPSRVWWSAIRDPQDWSPNAATQCDYQDLQFGGPVSRIIGSSEYAVVFQEEIIRRMNYQGGKTVFDIQPVDKRRGTVIPSSVISWGRFVFYIAPDGFYVFDGVESTPIGENHIDDEFYAFFDIQNAHLVSASIDPVLKNVFWAFPGEGNTGTANRLFIYHWPERKWSFANIELDYIGNMTTSGFTMEGLDAVGSNLDDASVFSVSLDSDTWKGGAERLGAFDNTSALGFFDGPTLSALLETADLQMTAGKRSQINGARLMLQSGKKAGVDVSIGHRKTLQDAVTYDASVELNVNGVAQLRTEDRFTRVCVSISASTSWSLIAGVEIEYEIAGDR